MRTLLLLLLALGLGNATETQAQDRPNILWITSEDTGPHLGCYGDSFADTPHLDGLARRGMRYQKAWSNAPVCAPARTTLISGLYPPATGSEHMRSQTRLPAEMKFYPQYLREAGYYCTNNSKEDYNLITEATVWDESSKTAHYRNRPAGKPFFAIFNFTVSHESRLRRRPHQAIHDPSGVRVPAYHPDTPEVRRDWAQYYDKVTEMDALAGQVLADLEADGLAENTIVFYYGDHGSGMPRNKRFPYNSGLHVPFIVSVPEKFRHLAPSDYAVGGTSDRLISFIDLAPTLLSLAGEAPAPHWHGHAFMGLHATSPPKYAFGFRGRMDERYDLIRSVRDQRYIYIRHFMPHKIYGQHIRFMFQTPTTQIWHDRYQAGTLDPHQALFWQPKPVEELYDLEADPDEAINLAASQKHQETLQRFRTELRKFQFKIRDVGFLPEAQLHTRSADSSPYEVGHDPETYPLKAIRPVALAASRRGRQGIPTLQKALRHDHSAVRYWGAMGYVNRGTKAVKPDAALLRKTLTDADPSVRVLAAEALAKHGSAQDLAPSLEVLLQAADQSKTNVWVAMLALNAIDELDAKAASLRDRLKDLPQQNPAVPRRYKSYVPNLLRKILEDLDAPAKP